MPEVRFFLSLTTAELLRYYQGGARFILVQATDGRKVRFPAANLRPFVTHDGVRGWFRLVFDAQGKLQRLEKIP